MHRTSEITIENFKSIRNASFSLEPFTPLVGYNNAVKTNILRALSWVTKNHPYKHLIFTIPKLQ